jgi:hypothetical protein
MPTADPGNHNLVAGEEWRIVGTLLDREGNPLDLTDAVIGWALLDQGGALVRANARIGVLDPPTSGIVNIELTAALVPGLYADELQITIVGRTSIVRGLSILAVAKNPFTS